MANYNSFGSLFRKQGKEPVEAPLELPSSPNEKIASPNPPSPSSSQGRAPGVRVTPASSPAGSTSTQLSKEQVAAIAARRSAAFAKIVRVLMRTPKYRQVTLADLEWLVAPAVASGQFLIAEIRDKASGVTVPVSAVLWAMVNDAVDQRLASTAGQPIHLKAKEWTTGSNPWLIAMAGEPRRAAALVDALVEKRLAASGIKTIARGADGKPAMRILRKKAGTTIPEAASRKPKC